MLFGLFALGPNVMRSSPVPPPLWMLIIAALEWALSRYWPLRTVLAGPYARLGWAVMVLALLPAAAAVLQFRRAHTTVNPHRPERSAVLVTNGVYAWTRNPMYLGLWLLLLGGAIRLGTASALLAAALFIPLIERVQIRAEEQALRRRFGVEYERYCERVHRWLGRSRPG